MRERGRSLAARQGGITLVDVMVAMLLLSVTLIGLAAALPVALRGVTLAGAQTTATWLARQALEAARTVPYGALPALDTGAFVAVPGHDDFSRAVTVQVGAPTAGTTTVAVTVRGPGVQGAHEVTLATVRGQ